jgi:hypothetical protein
MTGTGKSGSPCRYARGDQLIGGGAIGNAATGLNKAVGRWVLDRVGRYPSVWTMSSADAVDGSGRARREDGISTYTMSEEEVAVIRSLRTGS